MSHFTVMVIGDDPEFQLAPFHEYECTGMDDEFVVWVDEHDEHLAEYNEDKTHEGEPLNVKYATFEEFMKDWHGYDEDNLKDGRWGRKTNPNAEWDWYVVGGRWSGFLKMKEGTKGETGETGIFSEPAAVGYADSALKKDIDFEGMRQEARDAANESFDKLEATHKEMGVDINDDFVGWKAAREMHETIDEARDFYNSQPRVKAIKETFDNPFVSAEDYKCTREEYVESRALQSTVCYTFLQDRKWQARGEIGWWGMSLNEEDGDEFARKFNEILDGLPDDTRITVVDCHI